MSTSRATRMEQVARLVRMGRADEAEELLRHDVVVSEDPLQARTALADLLFQLDRLPEALAEFTALATNAPWPVARAARQGRAGVLFAMGRFGEALALYRALSVPPNDPNDFLVRASVAHVRAAMGHAEDAVVELHGLLAECRTRWGANAEVTLCTMQVLGDALLMSDQPAAAVRAFAETVALRTTASGPADSMVLCTRHMLGVALEKVGRTDEAERELLTAAARRDRPPSHSCSLATRQGLARVARARGQIALATETQETVVAGMTRLYGPDHPTTLESRYDAAELLRWRAYPTEARAAHREILAARTRVLGPHHPDTLKSAAAVDSH
ncbi:tetratricopeptide repeat protein [Actinophytocola sp.]|uniref:tetratricopeptide repeat protein n=1 Tax=Actinophytocola sp. TaxID=1872138 RepID=UPI00389A698E